MHRLGRNIMHLFTPACHCHFWSKQRVPYSFCVARKGHIQPTLWCWLQQELGVFCSARSCWEAPGGPSCCRWVTNLWCRREQRQCWHHLWWGCYKCGEYKPWQKLCPHLSLDSVSWLIAQAPPQPRDRQMLPGWWQVRWDMCILEGIQPLY